MDALDKSIEKWEKIVKDRRSVDNGVDNCALCQKYVKLSFPRYICTDCPVKLHTGKDFCKESPYAMWTIHQQLAHRDSLPYRRQKGCKTCDEIAQAELDFLRSLK